MNELPAERAGHVTFGCLNNFCKINDGVLDLWRRVLNEVTDAHLLVLADPGSHRQWVIDRLGVSASRVEFSPRCPRSEFLTLFHRIDLALDTLPYNGHTTALEALYMGVPTVTLPGNTVVGRAGVSMMKNVELTEWIATTAQEYVAIAARFARDLPGLAKLRSTLRRRMEQSPLMDAEGFTRSMENAYRQIWRAWCQRQG